MTVIYICDATAIEEYRGRILPAINKAIAELDFELQDYKKVSTDYNNGKAAGLEYSLFKLKEIRHLCQCKCAEHWIDQKNDARYKPHRFIDENQKRSFAWRTQVLIRDGYKCKKCGSKCGPEAHHIFSYKSEPHLRFDVNNGITLCEICHKKFHKLYGRRTEERDILSFLFSDRFPSEVTVS